MGATEHQLFWLTNQAKVVKWSFGESRPNGEDTRVQNRVRWLLSKYPELTYYFRLWSNRPPKRVADFMESIRASSAPMELRELQRMAHLLIKLGAATSLRFLQRYQDPFAQSLTPQYRRLIGMMNFEIPLRDELIFHAAQSDLYLFRANKRRTKNAPLLVCFCTKSNTLNAPLPIAHIALQRFATDILYVRNRIGVNPADGLADLDFETTATLLSLLIRKELGYERVFGLGTSVGGYAACVYASKLDFERVLNFSGAAGFSARNPANKEPLGRRVTEYPLKKILSVLSAQDTTDQNILQRYRESGFDTKLALVESSTHGSFTAALLEGKLPHLFKWLCAADAPQRAAN